MVTINPRRARLYEAEITRLKSRIEELETEVRDLKELVTMPKIPERVKQWMHEYDLTCWEVFWCFEHKKWFTELDTSFPYHMEQSRCPSCK